MDFLEEREMYGGGVVGGGPSNSWNPDLMDLMMFHILYRPDFQYNLYSMSDLIV